MASSPNARGTTLHQGTSNEEPEKIHEGRRQAEVGSRHAGVSTRGLEGHLDTALHSQSPVHHNTTIPHTNTTKSSIQSNNKRRLLILLLDL